MTLRFMADAIPLGATLGRVEIELAAAVILFALRELGREWAAPISQKEIGTVVGKALEEGREPVRTWASNPFLFPDFDDLVRRGFAVRTEERGSPTLALTPEALAKIAPHLLPLGTRVVHVERLEDAPAMVARAREVEA